MSTRKCTKAIPQDTIQIFGREKAQYAYRRENVYINDLAVDYPTEHDICKIMQVWSGGGYVIINENLFPLNSGYIFIIMPKCSHKLFHPANKVYCRSKITFNTDVVNKILSLTGQQNILDLFKQAINCVIIPDGKIEYKVNYLFQKYNTEMERSEGGNPAFLISILIEMLYHIYYSKYTSHKEAFFNKTRIDIGEIMTHINNNYFTNINIDELSERFYINKYYICHLFKKYTGFTIMQYLYYIRINESKKLIESTNIPISEIALKTGFSSLSFFGQIFKKHLGLTPSEYRKQTSGHI